MCVCICVIAFYVCKDQRMLPSPDNDVNIMKARTRYFSPQGSHVLHTNPPVSQHVTHHFFYMLNGLMVLACYIMFSCVLLYICSYHVLYVLIGQNGLSMLLYFLYVFHMLLGYMVL